MSSSLYHERFVAPVSTALECPPKAQREALVRTQDLRVEVGERPVLRGVTFSVMRGETVAVIGGSGCGKSTLLRALIGAQAPSGGKVELLHQNLFNLDDEQLDAVRKRFGVVFQSGALFTSMTVGGNVALPLREHTNLDEELISIIVKMKLDMVGLRDCDNLRPSELNDGMRKRVGVARALALDPEVIFYDEPSAGLDPVTTGVTDQLIVDLSKELGVTSVVVTHKLESAFRIANRLVMLYEGKVRAEGTPDELRNSEDPLVRQFIEGNAEGPITFGSRSEYQADLLAK